LRNRNSKDRSQLQELWSSLIKGALRFCTYTQHIQWALRKLLSSCIWLIQLYAQSSTPTESTAEPISFLLIMLNFLCFGITKTTGNFRKAIRPSSTNKTKKGMSFKVSSETECLGTDGLTRINTKTRMKLSYKRPSKSKKKKWKPSGNITRNTNVNYAFISTKIGCRFVWEKFDHL